MSISTPLLDLAPLREGASEMPGAELHHSCTETGCYFARNHRTGQALLDRTLAKAWRCRR